MIDRDLACKTKDPAMKIVNQYHFEFYESIIPIYRSDRDEFFLPLRYLCNTLGLNVSTQINWIHRNTVLDDGLVRIVAPVEHKDGSVREREITCLLLQLLPYWLATLNTKRLKPQLKKKIIRFQRELIDVTWDALGPEILPISGRAKLDITSPSSERN